MSLGAKIVYIDAYTHRSVPSPMGQHNCKGESFKIQVFFIFIYIYIYNCLIDVEIHEKT